MKDSNKKKFKKISPLINLSLVDKVELRLIEFFKENNLVPGDAIPKELDFVESLGVSRTVVREALLRLRTLGLIESRKHRGMILTQPDVIENMGRVMNPKLLGNRTLNDLFELRLILEMGMADVLFIRKRDQDIAELEDIVQIEEGANITEGSFDLDYEIAFHGKLYQMSNNITLQRFHVLLLPIFEYVNEQKINKIFEEIKHPKGEFISHRNLLDNLKIGNPETFRNAMRKHLEPHFANVQKLDNQ